MKGSTENIDTAALEVHYRHQTYTTTSSEVINAPPPSVEHPSDGRLRTWLQVVAALLINCIVWGYPASFGVFQLYYVGERGIPAAQVS